MDKVNRWPKALKSRGTQINYIDWNTFWVAV